MKRTVWFLLLVCLVLGAAAEKMPADSLSLSKDSTIARDSSAQDTTKQKRSNLDTLLAKASHLTPADTLHKQTTAVKPSPEELYKNVLFVGVGAGWTLGNFPVFTSWQAGLPDSLGSFGLSGAAGSPLKIDSTSSSPDTSALSFSIREAANTYNMAFPLSLSVVKFEHDRRYSATATFFYISKDIQATIFAGNDSIDRKIDFQQALSLYSVMLDLEYGYSIPKTFFSIDGVDMTYLVAGIGGSPYTSIVSSSKVSAPPPADPRMSAIHDSIASRMNDFNAHGYALSWKGGLLTAKAVHGGVIEAGVFYNGLWMTKFKRGNQYLLNSAINPQSADGSAPVSFITNRLELRVRFLFNKNPFANKNTSDSLNTPQPAAGVGGR